MEKKYNFGECTVIPDRFIIKGCGGTANRNLDRLIGYLKSIGREFYRADELARAWDATATGTDGIGYCLFERKADTWIKTI